MQKTALFDMDDTLIECGIYYREALRAGAEFIAGRTGFAADVVTKMIGDLDLAAVKATADFTKDRFPRSFLATSAAIDVLLGNHPDWFAADRAYDIGMTVFSAEYALRPHAIHTLIELRSMGYRIVLVTKGDTEVQQAKIDKHRLGELVDAVHIVPTKGIEVLRPILTAENVDIASSFMVGDSLKDDVAPAKALGLTTFHIAPTDQWSYNLADVTPTHSIHQLDAILRLVGVEAAV